MPKTLGILTSKDIPHLTPDDLLFCDILKKENIHFEPVIWDQADPIELKLDALLIRSPWDYHLNVAQFLKFLRDCNACGIQVINDLKTIEWNYSKTYMTELESKGLAIVDSLFFSRDDSVEKIYAELTKRQWINIVVKPIISASSHLTFKTESTSPQLKDQIAQISEKGDGMIQPFISSIATVGEVSLIFFNNKGAQFSHAVLKKPKSQDFRVQAEYGGLTESVTPDKKLLDIGIKSLATITTSWLYARVDLVDWTTSPLIGEIEMIEPGLFFSQAKTAPHMFVDALKNILI